MSASVCLSDSEVFFLLSSDALDMDLDIRRGLHATSKNREKIIE